MEPHAPREYDFDMSWGEGKNKIDLREPIGNCYGLMALAVQTAERLHYSKEAKQAMIDDMNSWDYVHVCEVFTKHFGHYFTLYFSKS